MKAKKFIKRLSDLKNAYRVLEIMDRVGCDIEEIPQTIEKRYIIKPKYTASKQDAEDLRKIVLYKHNYYGEHNRLWFLIFRNTRRNEGHRFL